MKKSKLTAGLVTGLLSVVALAGCDGASYSPEGYILTYKDASGETVHYTADELFGAYYNDSSTLSSVFDKTYQLIVRNYFQVEAAGIEKYPDIKRKAQNEVDGVKKKAAENADTNGTNYDDEFDSLLKNYSCDDEEELLEHFIYERELEEFEDQFYDNNLATLRDSKPAEGYDGYLNAKVPYHVKHVLVKVEESSASNYWNSSISEDNARDLYTVVNEFAKGTPFGTIASDYSDDGSASSFGDLGIMDKDTSYVNEFKLSIYAYENLFNGNAEVVANVGGSNIGMSADLKASFKSAVDYSEEAMKGDAADSIPTIPYGAFVKLNEYKSIVADENNAKVNDNNGLFYPRNIIFNKYLNKHTFAFITPNDVTTGTINAEGTAVSGENTYGVVNGNYTNPESAEYLPGFKTVKFNGVGDKTVLCDNNGNPIIVSFAGTSDYRGVHFIVIQRDALIATQNGVSLSDYYTTKYPGQEGYPQADGKDLDTYVNFIGQDTKELKARAESVESKIKSFDSNLNKYIFETYLNKEKIKFADEKLQEKIEHWIETVREKASRDDELAWEETWENYIKNLEQQKVERTKVISEACAIGYTKANSDTTGAWSKIGGVCNDNQNH